MIYIGADPGKSGGIAVIGINGPYAFKMPETHKDLLDDLSDIRKCGECRALIEKVHSSPQMGVKSAFTFGEGYGALRMAFAAAEIPYDDVSPQKWQGALGCRTGGDKNVSKAKAQQLFPSLKITHAIADALLIAEYCRRIKV